MNDTRTNGDARIAAGGPTDPDRRASVFATLATSLGGPGRVLLRDTDADGDGDAPSEPPARPGSAEMPPPGAGPGGLQLLGEIARGGMGAVLKGRDPDLSRDLAVKVLLDRHRDDPDLLRRFVEEAQIAGQLQHPGIVPVYRLGMLADRRPYFTMKLVKGRTLAALLDDREPRPRGLAGGAEAGADGDRRPLFDDLPRFIAIFEQVCRTVAYAHSRGVIHRDLKPSNIMVGGFGEVQVMDWGLAKVMARGEIAPRPDEPPAPADRTVVATARSGGGTAGPDLSRAARSSARPPTWPPSRPAARSTASTPAPTSSPSARSCARPSPAARRTPAGGPPRCAAWRRGATPPRPWRRSTAAAATPSWSPSPATAWPPSPRAARRMPAPSPTASPPTWPAWASGCDGPSSTAPPSRRGRRRPRRRRPSSGGRGG